MDRIALAAAIVAACSSSAFAEPSCRSYQGTLSGNHEGAFRLDLCGETVVEGRCGFYNDAIGWSMRSCAGSWDGDHLSLHDVEMIDKHERTEVRLCSAERYELDRDGRHVRGRFDSAACDDHGTIDLVETTPAPSPPAPDVGRHLPPDPPPPLFFVDILHMAAVGEVNGQRYDLNAVGPYRGDSRFLGNVDLRGGTFLGGGIGARVLRVFPRGLVVGGQIQLAFGQILGVDSPYASLGTATRFELVGLFGYALRLGPLLLHALARAGFDTMSLDVANPLVRTAALSSGPSTADGAGDDLQLSRTNLRAGVDVGAHVRLSRFAAVWASGGIDWDGEWRAMAGVAVGRFE